MLPAAQHIYSNSFLSFPFFFWQKKWWRITFRSTPDTLLAGAMPAKSCFILCFCSNSPALFFSTHILTKLGNCDQEPCGSEQRNNVEGAAKEGFWDARWAQQMLTIRQHHTIRRPRMPFFFLFLLLITIEVLFLSFLFFSSFNNDTQESDSSSLITKLQPHLGIKLCLQVLHRSSTGL